MSNNNSRKIFDKLVSKTKIYLVIIAILIITLCIYEVRFITPGIIGYALIIMYAYWTNNKRKAELSAHIKDLTLTVDTAAKSTLINSPFPLVIIETDGNIIWKSSKFIHEFANVDISTHLNNIVKEINKKYGKEMTEVPTIVIIKDGKISSSYNIKENKYNIKLLEKYLEKEDVIND